MTRLWTAALFTILVAAGLLTNAGAAQAHALQPGYLELKSLGQNSWQVFWRVPDVKGKPMGLIAVLPENCSTRRAQAPQFNGTVWVSQWISRCAGGLGGGQVTIEGLALTNTDVLVRYELESGQGESQRLTADTPSFDIPITLGPWHVLTSYFSLGLDHILGGIDHLLFVLALLLLIHSPRRLIGAITAFTLAHSLTLAAAALGWLNLPAPPVEAIIALSIMFVAAEALPRRTTPTTTKRLSIRAPWLIAFAFGLLHGLGFGSALLDIGLPQSEIILALLAFNIGVEAGQLLFIFAVLALFAAGKRIFPVVLAPTGSWFQTGATAMPYAIGCVASFWFFERLAGF